MTQAGSTEWKTQRSPQGFGAAIRPSVGRVGFVIPRAMHQPQGILEVA